MLQQRTIPQHRYTIFRQLRQFLQRQRLQTPTPKHQPSYRIISDLLARRQVQLLQIRAVISNAENGLVRDDVAAVEVQCFEERAALDNGCEGAVGDLSAFGKRKATEILTYVFGRACKVEKPCVCYLFAGSQVKN